MKVRIWAVVGVSALALAFACSDDDSGANGGAGTGGQSGNAGSGGSSGTSGSSATSGSSGTGGDAGGGNASSGGSAGSSGMAGASGTAAGGSDTGGAAGAGATAGTGGGTGPTQDGDGNWICTAADGTTHLCQCNDGMDNDGDQTIDTLDPNCAGAPYNDSEEGSPGGTNCGTTACANCMDDDGDGLVDSADPECTGALDNDESSFATGLPGDNSDACKQDCFFDGDSGSGNDGCLWDLRCDPLSPGSSAAKACPYDASYNNCPATQQTKCLDKCATFTPNGCDCFGCCSIFVDDVEHVVKLLPGCTVEQIDNPAVCPPCTKNTACNNDCKECEFCLGKAPPPSCNPPGTGGAGGGAGTGGSAGTGGGGAGGTGGSGQCPNNLTPCTPGTNECGSGKYCLTGCCVPLIE